MTQKILISGHIYTKKTFDNKPIDTIFSNSFYISTKIFFSNIYSHFHENIENKLKKKHEQIWYLGHTCFEKIIFLSPRFTKIIFFQDVPIIVLVFFEAFLVILRWPTGLDFDQIFEVPKII